MNSDGVHFCRSTGGWRCAKAAGEVFNVANGNPTRWSHLWPAFGDYFGVPAGGPPPIPLSSFMPELAPLWRDLAAKYGLAQPELGSLVNRGFLEFLFAIEYDIVLAMGKIRRAGFTRHPDTRWRMAKVTRNGPPDPGIAVHLGNMGDSGRVRMRPIGAAPVTFAILEKNVRGQ